MDAGPYEGLAKEDLPAQLCAFTHGVTRVWARHHPGHYDLVHSHYWLSGRVGSLTAERWGVPLVHAMHTMAKVKNAGLAEGDTPEPAARVLGESQIVRAADRLIANTEREAEDLRRHYDADAGRIAVVHPGVDLDRFRPGPRGVAAGRAAARSRLGLPQDALIPLFVGRIQPLKAPDVLLRAVARLLAERPWLRERTVVPVVGGPSGSGLAAPDGLHKLAAALGIGDVVRFWPPVGQHRLVDWYRAASVLVMPSYSESFGLVAVEAQACGTPVIAAEVGGLPVAVRDGVSGVLVPGTTRRTTRPRWPVSPTSPRAPPGWARPRPGTHAPSAGTRRRPRRRTCTPRSCGSAGRAASRDRPVVPAQSAGRYTRCGIVSYTFSSRVSTEPSATASTSPPRPVSICRVSMPLRFMPSYWVWDEVSNRTAAEPRSW